MAAVQRRATEKPGPVCKEIAPGRGQNQSGILGDFVSGHLPKMWPEEFSMFACETIDDCHLLVQLNVTRCVRILCACGFVYKSVHESLRASISLFLRWFWLQRTLCISHSWLKTVSDVVASCQFAPNQKAF